MSNTLIKLYAVICLLLIPFIIDAQSSVVSPYSRIGLGQIHDQNLPHIKAKGGLGSTDWSYLNLNLTNPASYAFLRSASLNAGVNIQYNRLSDEDSGTNAWNGGLNYLAIGFPLINPVNEMMDQTYSDWRFGTVLALQPFSQVGYQIQSTEMDPEVGQVIRDYRGDGGSQIIFLGQAFRYRNTSLGFNAGYLFGSINQERIVEFSDQQVHYLNDFTDEIKMNGFYWKVGFIQDIILERSENDPYFDERGKPLRYITLGFTGKTATNFNNSTNTFHFGSHRNLPGIRDTLNYGTDVKSKGTLPPEFGFGASYNLKDKLQVGFDFSVGLWSNYENEAKDEDLDDSWKIAVGGTYTPDHQSIMSFFERVTYSGGVYYQKDPRSFGSDQLDEYGLSFGMTFPFIVQRRVSSLHTAFQIGRRSANEGLKETFVNLSVGFTVNDNSWFIKRRFD